ncbi:phage baseplate protein [Paenibacillus sp. Dod16]|uniref:phage baseplate protein n=1 Tax=Paenibacillus sp. Dod16 TaxID=3416392 RepID=UPI003CEA5073
MATINGHYLLVEDESYDFSIDVTDQPVEKDIDVTDHVQRKPRVLSLTGVVVENAAKFEAFLKDASEKGSIVRYVGRTTFTGLITGFAPTRNYKNATGFAYSLTIKEIRVATTSYVNDLPLPVKAQTVKIVNSGTKQTKDKKKSKKSSKTSSKKTSKKSTKEKVEKVKFKPGSPWAN